jgi:DNA repair protein RecO (recombination protein O)
MTDQRISGIVLRVYPLTESSLVVHWITQELGRISTVANGAKRAKSPFLGKLDLLFSADLVVQLNRRSNLHRLKEVSVRQTRQPLRHSIPALRRVAYAIRLLEQATESDTPIPEIHALFESFIDAVAADPGNPLLALAFELRLLDQLGLSPIPDAGPMQSPTHKIARVLLEEPWASLGQVRPTPVQERELWLMNARVLLAHLGRLPDGRNLALDPSEKS